MKQPIPQTPAVPATASIHPKTEIGVATLKVADLDRSLKFYTEIIGLHPLTLDAQSATLSAGSRSIMRIEAVPAAQRQPHGTTGLYHVAILLPDRATLIVKMAQIAAARYPISGYADHLVSEAFYLNDPDGNGLEIYRDRPRDQWPRVDGQIQMASNPIDLDEFFSTVSAPALPTDPSLPVGTTLGHMHLRVGNIPVALQFYHNVLGFDLITTMPNALFLSAGGYHHHIGMNIWESRNGQAPPESSVGLREFSIWLPDIAERDRLVAQMEASGIAVEHQSDTVLVRDPWQTQIALAVRP